MKEVFKIEGSEEFNALVEEMQDDFGIKDQKNILTNAARASMKPVERTAKQLLISNQRVDTGMLLQSIKVSAKKPNAKDIRSRYVSATDVAIGIVSAYINPQTFQFFNFKSGSNFKQIGAPSDARANVVEFGSYKMAATPYLRPALESNGQVVVNGLGTVLGKVLEKYKSKHKGK
jgi:hypothetical protein